MRYLSFQPCSCIPYLPADAASVKIKPDFRVITLRVWSDRTTPSRGTFTCAADCQGGRLCLNRAQRSLPSGRLRALKPGIAAEFWHTGSAPGGAPPPSPFGLCQPWRRHLQENKALRKSSLHAASAMIVELQVLRALPCQHELVCKKL